MSIEKNKAYHQTQKGQSVIEIIIAVAILVIIAATAVMAVLGGLSINRLGKEEDEATFFAKQGIEALRSLRNQGWDDPFLATDCTSGCGLSKTGDNWSFSGTSDDPNGTGKFTRVVKIEATQRDGSGNLVNTGGTTDEDMYKITSTVTWNFTPARTNRVNLISYLANWSRARYNDLTDGDCALACQGLGYSAGVCRNGIPECSANGETYDPALNKYCGFPSLGATCCCQP